MSLADARARLWLPMNESAASVYPSDASGYVADPTLVGATKPSVVTGAITGYARDFVRASSHGFAFADTTGALRLTRGVTVVALLRVDFATMGVGAIGEIIQRGRGGAADPIAFALRATAESSTSVRLQLRWQTEAGADVIDGGVAIAWPSGEYLLVAATREVINGAFRVRYFLNGQAVGGGAFALDCGGATSATVSLGHGMTSTPSQVNFLDGAIDSLEVLNEAITDEEAAWLWMRIAKDQPDGAAAMRRMQPPGVYSQDPTSRVQLEIAVEGAMLGYTKAIARRLRDYFLPGSAWGEFLARWETVTGHSPKAGDWVQRRRDRVLSFLETVRGFSVTDVKDQLLETFATSDPADVQIIEYDNDFTEAFASGTPSTHAVIVAGNGTWLSDVAAVAAGYQEVSATAQDLRYKSEALAGASMYLWSLANGVDAWVHGQVDPVTLSADVIQGFAFGDRAADDYLFVGLSIDGGTSCVATLRYTAGVLATTKTVIETPWTADPTYFRIWTDGAGSYLVKYGASDAAAKAHAGVVVAGPKDPRWAGFAVAAQGNKTSATLTCRFRSFFSHTPNGSQRLSWYAYRDPALGGSPDMDGARLIVGRVKPAHTEASAVERLTAICDDPGSRCDREPIGA